MKVFPEYPDLAAKASKTLLPFPTSYICEFRFFVMAATKTKLQNRQDVGDILRVSLSSIIPRWERLVAAKQAQDSHWIKDVIIYTSCNKYSMVNIRGFLKAGPRKNFSFKPDRSAKMIADPCFKWCLRFPWTWMSVKLPESVITLKIFTAFCSHAIRLSWWMFMYSSVDNWSKLNHGSTGVIYSRNPLKLVEPAYSRKLFNLIEDVVFRGQRAQINSSFERTFPGIV